MGTETLKVVNAADARALSPATLEDLEADLSRGGTAYRFLSGKADSLLDHSRTPNPLAYDGRWAFDIDGFVFVTQIPHGMGQNWRDAREVLDAMLRRSIDVSTPSPNPVKASSSGLGLARVDAADHAADAGQIDRILSAAHYTAVPAWLLSGELDLAISERILLSDVLDVLSRGMVLSYEYSSSRVLARCGLVPSTSSDAMRGLARRGLLLKVEGAKGRYTANWPCIADYASQCREGARAVGAAMTQGDMRRRLCSKKHSLAVPNWAVELCGVTESALLLAKAWSNLHSSDGIVWASGATLSTWLPGSERSLRRARASLADDGLVCLRPQYSCKRSYRGVMRPNRTAEFNIDLVSVACRLLHAGHDFGDLGPIAAELFSVGGTREAKDAAATPGLPSPDSEHGTSSENLSAAKQLKPDTSRGALFSRPRRPQSHT